MNKRSIAILDAFVEWFSLNHKILQEYHATATLSGRIIESPNPSQYVDIDFDNIDVYLRIAIWSSGDCDRDILYVGVKDITLKHNNFRHYYVETQDDIDQVIKESLVVAQEYL